MGTVYAKTVEGFPGIGPSGDFDYNDVVGESKDLRLEGVKARVDRVHVEGLARTKNDIVEDAVQDLFTAQDFQDVLVKAHRVRLKLDSLGCFRNIAVFIDTSKGPKATPDGLEVTYNVKEYRKLTGGVNTQVGNNEGSLLIGMRAPNLFGRGERLQCEYSYGSKRTNNFNVAFIKPLLGKSNRVLTASVFQGQSELPSSGYRTLDRGFLFDFGINSYPMWKHNIQWEAVIRDLSVLSRSSAFDVREESGVSLKSALRHILSIDQRDEPIFPSCGRLIQVTTELAGVGGDIGYLKNEAYLQYNFSLFQDFVLQWTLMGGYLNAIFSGKKISIIDKFHLGGPLNLRGFDMRGVGPQSDGDSLGSMAYFSSGLHLYTPLPFRPGKGGLGELFRTHAFVNIGNVDNIKPDDEDKSVLVTMGENLRVAFGLGVAIRLGQMARVEVNYCFPFRFDKADRLHPGVQFGIGVLFV